MIFWRRPANECERNRAAFSAYLDRRLADSERQAMDSHMERCDHCALELAALRATVESLRSLPTLRTPRSFVLPARIAAPAPAPWYFYVRNAAAAVAVLLVLIVGFNFTSAPVGSPVAKQSAVDAASVRPTTSNGDAKSGSSRVEPDLLDRSEAAIPEAAAATRAVSAPASATTPAAAPMAASAPAPAATSVAAAAAPSAASVPPRAATPAPSVGAAAVPAAETGLRATAPEREPAAPHRDIRDWPLFEAQLVLAGAFAVLIVLTLLLRRKARR